MFKKLNTPEEIQSFIDQEIEYDSSREDRSVSEVIETRRAECFNGALFALACLRKLGIKASIIELIAIDDEEHVLCVYKQNGKWGSIAQSKLLGLKGRNPVYGSIRELVVSYMEFYFAYDGRYSLSSFTEPLNLTKYKNKWLTDGKVVEQIGKDLKKSKHFYVRKISDPVHYVTPERYWREILIFPKGTKVPKKYLIAKPK